MRFVAPYTRHDRRAAAGLRRRVRSIPGVRSVRLNPITGSLIVHIDAADDTRERVLGALTKDHRGMALTKAPRQTSHRALLPEADRLADRLATVVAKELVERMLRMAIMALI
jgi:hypothetical protein